MQYLLLQNNADEFFKNDIPITFLAGIKDINLIIGANNTRKSRFLRSIINQSHNTLIKRSNDLNDLNEVYQKAKNLFESISDEMIIEKLIQIQFNGSNSSSTNNGYTLVKNYFGAVTRTSFSDLASKIETINNNLISLVDQKGFEALKFEILSVHTVVELLIDVYVKIAKDNGYADASNYKHTVVPGITYFIPLKQYQYKVEEYEFKIKKLQEIELYLNELQELNFEFHTKEIIYIPVLRTSRVLAGSEGDIFSATIVQQYSIQQNNKLKIETGLELYSKIGLARNGSINQRRDFQAFEKFIGSTFFQSEEIHIVARQSGNQIDRVIIVSLPDELDDIPIHHLGDGVQSVINLLFPVFTAEDGAWIFIDEPENHLHPGFQNIFISAITENEYIRNKHLRFFINTHSNHILSKTLLSLEESEILVFSKRDKNSTSIQSFAGNEYSTLEALGVFNTSVLISNCTVWVEGITDRFYLQSFLYAYCNTDLAKDFRPFEGLNYSFLEYGGKNIIHYNFEDNVDLNELNPPEELKDKIEAYFINSNIFLIADSDFKPSRHSSFTEINRPNFRFFQTDVPEIENVLPDDIIKSYLLEELKCKIEDVERCFPLKHYKKLGNFLDNKKIVYGNGFRKFEAASGGGTLAYTYKKGLADFVHRKILDKTFVWDDLAKSKILSGMVEELYKFIKDKNGK